MVELKVNRIDKAIELPYYAKKGDAALDLRSRQTVLISPNQKALIATGLKLAIPVGYCGLIWDRSGIAAKHGVHCLAGVIDSGYRGEIKVVMHNLSDKEFLVEKNMRIAQLLIQPVAQAKIIEVEELDETERYDNGFGSTGLK